MKAKKLCLAALVGVMTVSTLSVPALARQNFSDLPGSHWAYADVMKVAEAGIIEGTGNNSFSPNVTLSADQFLTMVGRTCYNDEITAQPGDNWSAPYIRAAKEKGFLENTTITDETVTQEISRYDMAAILTNVGKNFIGITGNSAADEEVANYTDIPQEYAAAVLWAYGNDLLQGDGNGNFNGSLSVTRATAATVISRLMEKTSLIPAPDEETIHMHFHGYVCKDIFPQFDHITEPVELSLYYFEKLDLVGKDPYVKDCAHGKILLAKTWSDNTGYFEFDLDVPEKYYKQQWDAFNYYIDGGTIAYEGETLIGESRDFATEEVDSGIHPGWGMNVYFRTTE